MTITVTSITRNQWKKVGTVALWVILTNGIGILTAYLTSKPQFLAIGPALNVAGKAIQQIFQTEEDQAFGQLPVQVVKPIEQAVNETLAAVDTPVNTPPTSPNIGSTVNS